MSEIRLVPAVLAIVFDKGTVENSDFMKEYYSLMQMNDDPLGAWLKTPKIRKIADDSDQVLLTLLIELHRKIDTLTHSLHSDSNDDSILTCKASIESIGHGYFQCDTPALCAGEHYYGRIDLPTFPRRNIPVFFRAQSETLAKIEMMHDDDEQTWSAYMVACERAMIRQMKGLHSEY
ncbi:MAG: hypothetical protein PHN18_03835 [Sulfurospirillaceae bacterium]|jgi:hypothetical protein|nr:hypothetical protein [Sulfurospirillaceae bacterium]MDD2825461.1 hypothetical protein [Sulfurospirillaceae bacterium]MDD3342003.1 hypothetical protein [Sulfurospirillaceae bacterium]